MKSIYATKPVSPVTGVVKWFNSTKGFGFLNQDGSTQDIFVHYSSIYADGYRNLEEGQRVHFDLYADPGKGLQARNVEVLS